jgi:hypothetical protein
MMRAAVLAFVLCAAGCPEDVSFPPRDDAGVPPGEGIELHGRVVDFETCPIPPGCAPVEGMVVEVSGGRAPSQPTGREGAFIVYDAPKDQPLSLTVRGSGSYARTIAAAPVAASDDDVFDILLYVLPSGAGTLLEGVRRERSVDLEDSGGYVGQAVAQIVPEGDPLCPDLEEGLCAIEDVVATVRPEGYGVVVYVNALPSFVPEGPVILANGHATTATGMFVVLPGTPDTAALDVLPTHPELRLPVITAAPIEPGAVTLGFHRAD